MRRAALVFLSLTLLTAMAAAQTEPLPDSPSSVPTVAAVQPPASVIAAAAKPRRTADGAYWSMMSLSALAMVADVETTVRAVQNPRCREANPLVGDNPTRTKMYAMKGGAGALIATLSYVGKKKGWSKWWLMPMLTTGAHGGVAVSNWRTGCF